MFSGLYFLLSAEVARLCKAFRHTFPGSHGAGAAEVIRCIALDAVAQDMGGIYETSNFSISIRIHFFTGQH